jgi:hypothetical protein
MVDAQFILVSHIFFLSVVQDVPKNAKAIFSLMPHLGFEGMTGVAVFTQSQFQLT